MRIEAEGWAMDGNITLRHIYYATISTSSKQYVGLIQVLERESGYSTFFECNEYLRGRIHNKKPVATLEVSSKTPLPRNSSFFTHHLPNSRELNPKSKYGFKELSGYHYIIDLMSQGDIS